MDGGSSDETLAVARAAGARTLVGNRGRASQMNLGAEAAGGSILLFLHGDTKLPSGFASEVTRVLASPKTVAGAFRLGIDAPGAVFRIIEKAVELRSRWLHLPYGDQALFLERERFRKIGGFPALPILEDLEMVRRLHSLGRIGLASTKVVTSGRRWQSRGPLRLTWIHQLVLCGYFVGVDPSRIAGWYRRFGGPSAHETEKSTDRVETFGRPPAS